MQAAITQKTTTVALPVLVAISASHLLNDTVQSLISAIYPIIKDSFGLSFLKIGIISLVFQLSSSVLQPLVGWFFDKRPVPFALPAGMAVSFCGVLLLSVAPNFSVVLVSVALIGVGSAIFHPEASRITYLAAGNRRGFAQSLFQLGGNFGSAAGPLLAAVVISPYGQHNIAWFGVLTFLAMVLLYYVGKWYRPKVLRLRVMKKNHVKQVVEGSGLPQRQVTIGVILLLVLLFSKYFYSAGLASYYTFYLIERFGVSVQQSQVYLFVYLASTAVGTLLGGALGDKFGRKPVILLSIFGAVPFTLALPYLPLFWTVLFTVFIGLVMSSAFPSILVYAQELLPGKIGSVSGLFYGLAFGFGGIASAILGQMADVSGIVSVYVFCSFLPLIGIVALLLPKVKS